MAQGKPSKSKLRRVGADKAYYTRYKEQYRGKVMRRRADREKRVTAARDFPHIGSPSQIRIRRKRLAASSVPDATDISNAVRVSTQPPAEGVSP